jgi:flagellin
MANIDVARVAGNIGALNALNSLNYVNNQLAIHQTRLSTGKRLNESADDPAGLHLATSFQVRSEGLQTTLSALGDAKNMMSSMEGGLKKIQDILVKMRNKALEATGDTIGTAERNAVNTQLKDYRSEIDTIAQQTQWNGVHLITGSAAGTSTTQSFNFLTGPDVGSSGSATGFSFQANSTAGIQANQSFYASGSASNGQGLGLFDTSIDVATNGSASAATAVTNIDNALKIVKAGISQVGSFTARLTFKEDALSTQYTNTEAAYNRIMNANMADEQVQASKFAILQQTSTAMLAQANAAPQFLLSLFR